MPVDIRQTTTNYVHPTDPNLLNIHKAMKFNSDGEPVVRTHVDGISLQGDVIVDTVSLSSSTLAALESVNVQNNVTATITGSVLVSNFPTTTTVYQGTTPWVVKQQNTATDLTIADSTYWMNVTRGLVPGQYLESKNGYRTDMAGSTESSIWDGPTALYPWDSWTVAQKLYIVSTNASDTQTLVLDGLDASYARITETITITGTTPIVTVNNFLRLNRCNISVGTANVGTITLHLVSGTGTVVGHMDPGFSRIKGGYVTIPAGYTGYILNMSATQFRGGAGNIGGVLRLYSHLPNGPFILQVIAEVVNGQWHQELTYPLICPATMDIDFRMVPDGNGTQATCFYQLLYIATP